MNKVILTVVQGSLLAKQFTFEERTTCVMGRALDCNILLPDDSSHSTISRYHCLLDINPPEICIRDFGSLNGTYVNGKKIGQRGNNSEPSEVKQISYPEYNLKNGDQITLGDSVFQVSILNDNKKTEGSDLPLFTMDKSVPDNSSVNKVNDDPLDKINLLLDEAKKDNKQLISIKGYHIVKELGKGNMGIVYLAQKDDDKKSMLALKMLLPKGEGNSKSQQQFIRETKNTQLLDHKNIVKVYDIGCYEDTCFYTTDYCEAGNIAQLINRKGGKLPLFQSIKILLQVLDGLEFAHSVKIPAILLADGTKTSATGLVHRDLKPGNIMLTKVNDVYQIKIVDFGLAKAFDTAGLSGRTATGASAGTPYYMPRPSVFPFKSTVF
ncbi:MAG: protein kinase [gamma proteobacterium symbiont of Lucinoma myriamae]|nr:protein kinase [gamma proteobacterium symbiont of Lucinoma myriamae]MCU7832388.1 protein kinase [gamma proteobacterium symbiont of Lucinoma myriamae]